MALTAFLRNCLLRRILTQLGDRQKRSQMSPLNSKSTNELKLPQAVAMKIIVNITKSLSFCTDVLSDCMIAYANC